MVADSTIIPLIRTKLHRPPVAREHVHRTRLLDRLNKRLYRPLTLVSYNWHLMWISYEKYPTAENFRLVQQT